MSRRSQKKRKWSFGKFLIIPVIFMLGLMVYFYVSDEFMLMAQLFLLNQDLEANSFSGWSEEDEYLENDVYTGLTGGSGSSPGSLPRDYGSIGPQMVLLNKMGGSYMKDWLSICFEHVNWNSMQIEPVKRNGNDFYPNILLLIGGTLAESGWPSNYLPETILDLSYYDQTIDGTVVNLYNVDSSFIFSHQEIISSDFDPLSLKSGSYYTQFQFSRDFFSIYPNALSGTGAEPTYLPSKMNSRGMNTLRLRSTEDSDAGYFPDQVSVMIQSSWGRLNKSVNTDNIGAEIAVHLSYVAHNLGEGFYFLWGTGGRGGNDRDNLWSQYPHNNQFGNDCTTLNSKNGELTYRYIASESINELSLLIEKARTYLYGRVTSAEDGKNVNSNVLNFRNHGDYEALFTVMTLLDGGFIASEKSLSHIQYHMSNDGWMRGALLGYQLMTNNWSATKDDVKNYLNGLTVQTVDTDFYGPVYPGKQESAHEIVVHKYCPHINVYNQSGEGPRPALHAYNSESARGVFMSAIGAPYIYWNMLLAAGVECTLAEAFADATGIGNGTGTPTLNESAQQNQGQLITQLTQTTAGVDGSYYSDFALGFFSDDTRDSYKKTNSPMYYRDPAGGGSAGIHGGEDYPLSMSTRLISPGNGTVRTAQKMNGYGQVVIIDLDTVSGEPQVAILFAHMNKIGVSSGDRVVTGQYVGDSGASGQSDGVYNPNAYGAHLHIEIRVSEQGTELRVPYGGVAINKDFTVKNAPRLRYTAKKDPGYIYMYTGDKLSCSKAKRYSGATDNQEISWSGHPSSFSSDGGDYYKTGIMYWKDDALAYIASHG